jgi:hypothetical protein
MRRSLLPILALVIAACGGGGGDEGSARSALEDGAVADALGTTDPTSDAAPTTDANTGGDATSDEYPAGPYGTKVGEVLADIALEGYLHADASSLSNLAPYKATRLSEIRRFAPVKYGILHVGEFW